MLYVVAAVSALRAEGVRVLLGSGGFERIVREQEARLGELLRRNPDLMAVRRSACDPTGCSYPPEDIVLALEVVSPSSRTRDRLHKPAEYAEAGIPHYWRVEIKPELAVHTYRRGETGSYLETGLFVPGDTIAAPGLRWADIDVDLVVGGVAAVARHLCWCCRG